MRLSSRGGLVAATVALWCLQGAAPLSAQSDGTRRSDWKQLTTPAYTIISEGGEGRAREVAAQIDAFREAIRQVFPAARLDGLVPTTLIVFDSDASFSPFKPLDNGRRVSWVGGYALAHNDGQHLVMSRGGSLASTYSIVFHEYMHAVLGRTYASLPVWYNEGVAEVFGAFAGTIRDSRPMIGRPILYRAETARAEGLLPVRDMLVDESAARWQARLTSRFYATSWLMAHYFLFDAERRQQLLQLFRELEGGATVDVAVQQALGMTVEQLDQQLENYLRRSQMPALGFTSTTTDTAAAEVTPLTETALARVHGDLLVRLGDRKGAEELLKRATARAPADDGLRTVTAQLRISQDRPEDALTVLQAAPAPRSLESLRAEGHALLALDRYDEAAARLTSAAAMAEPSPALLYEMGRAHMGRRAWPQATATFNRLRALDPRPSWDLARTYEAYRQGLGVYVAGAARAYITSAGWASIHSPYAAFAGVLGLMRDGRTDEAAALAAEIDAHTADDEWPGQVAGFLRATITARALIARASSDRERTEAHAYVGLAASAAGRRDEALEHLRWVTTQGEHGMIEYRWSLAELARLEAAAGP
jgi:tetratricopeptide (TPR) repeat protein